MKPLIIGILVVDMHHIGGGGGGGAKSTVIQISVIILFLLFWAEILDGQKSYRRKTAFGMGTPCPAPTGGRKPELVSTLLFVQELLSTFNGTSTSLCGMFDWCKYGMPINVFVLISVPHVI